MQSKVFSFLMAFAAVVLLGGAAQAQQKFTAALNTIQEVPATTATSNGRGSCVVTLNTARTQISVTCEYSRLSSGLISGHIHGNAAPGVNAGILFNFNPPTGSTSGTFNAGPFDVTAQQVADMRAKLWYINLHTTNNTGGEIRGQVKIQTTPYDYDGDGRTDLKVFRAPAAGGNGTVFTQSSLLNNTIFGNVYGFSFEIPFLISANDDFDGDGRADIIMISATASAANGGSYIWRILQTATNTIREVRWGLNGVDDIVPADYDGDGKSDIAVYRYTNGAWYILQSSNNQPRYEFWGQAGNGNEFGMVGDFDGDGKNDLTTRRPGGNGTYLWSTKRSSDGQERFAYWGSTSGTDQFFSAAQVDVDGDGIQDRMALRDPAPNTTGNQVVFYVQRSSDGAQFSLPFGLDTDYDFFTVYEFNVTGDYDGDGKTDFATRRPEGGIFSWYIALSSNNWNTAAPRLFRFGQSTDLFAPETESQPSEQLFTPRVPKKIVEDF